MVKESKSIMIEAKLRGPGPGRYGLPATCGQTGHDFSKHMKPAFSFGGQLPLKDNVSQRLYYLTVTIRAGSPQPQTP